MAHVTCFLSSFFFVFCNCFVCAVNWVWLPSRGWNGYGFAIFHCHTTFRHTLATVQSVLQVYTGVSINSFRKLLWLWKTCIECFWLRLASVSQSLTFSGICLAILHFYSHAAIPGFSSSSVRCTHLLHIMIFMFYLFIISLWYVTSVFSSFVTFDFFVSMKCVN